MTDHDRTIGQLETKVENLERIVGKMNDKLDNITTLVEQARGAKIALSAISVLFGGIGGFATAFIAGLRGH